MVNIPIRYWIYSGEQMYSSIARGVSLRRIKTKACPINSAAKNYSNFKSDKEGYKKYSISFVIAIISVILT